MNVVNRPDEMIEGRDPQLERAIEEIKNRLAENETAR